MPSTYLDGPHETHLEIFRDCYKNDPSADAVEIAAELATPIDYWLCGDGDDGDESQEFILARAVERAARFIAAQPCTCDSDEVCGRCRAIGCSYGEHRHGLGCGGGQR